MEMPLTPLEFKRRAVHLFGHRVGVVDGDKRFTWRQWGERVDRLAGVLKWLGLEKGGVVSLLTPNTHHILEAYYAVAQAGGIMNPINIRLSPAEITYILNHAETAILIAHRDFLPVVKTLRHRVAVRHVVVTEFEGQPPDLGGNASGYERLLEQADPDPGPDLTEVDERGVAELFYTSGTTGKPKGAMLTHRSLYLHALYDALAMGLNDSEVALHVVPLFHVNGWGTAQTITMLGGKHVMLRRVEPKQILELVEREGVTHLCGVPTVYTALVNYPDLHGYDLSSLRRVVLGGAPTPVALIQAIEEKLGCCCFGAYGLTETTPSLTKAVPRADLAGLPQEGRWERQASAGYAEIGTEIRVVDEQGEVLPADGQHVGEIAARGNVVMERYLNDPEGTQQALRGGWFHTGDLATLDPEGYLRIVDRKKDIIISGGENISSAEVEGALYAHPAVLECAVIAVPDAHWGEVPKALVVLKLGSAVSAEELIAFCRGRLAPFKVPKSVEFRSEFPKAGTGKILKAQLREPYWVGQERRVH